MYTHLYTNFGQITDGDLEESLAGITGQYDFATRPMPQLLHMVRKAQQLHGNAIPPRLITDNETMGISYLNFQRSGTYPLDYQEWEMRDPTTKSFANLQTAFIAAERRLRTQRGQGVPQGIANNLEDLHRALEGLTMVTAQEREDVVAARMQNDNLQVAVNALQMQMAGFIPPNGPTVNAVTRQQPPAQNTGQQQAPP